MSTAAPTYQARLIKRSRRTKAQIEQLEDQIIDVLWKTTLRACVTSSTG